MKKDDLRDVQATMERAFDAPRNRREDIAWVLREIDAGSEVVGGLTPEERDDLVKVLAEARSNAFTTEADIEALVDRYFWPLTDEERAELEEAEREIERGEVASDEEVAALYRLARR